MKKLSEIVTRVSLHDLVEAIVDGSTLPEVKPEGEKKFVKLHKVEKHAEREGNKDDVRNASNVKKDTSKAGEEPKEGFPPEVKEEEQLDEISKYTLRQYMKAAPKKIGNLAYNVGLRGGDKNDPDAKKAERHAVGIKKVGERLQNFYRPKHVRERNPRYGGIRKYEGATSSQSFYKPNEEDKARAKEKSAKWGANYTAQREVPYKYKDMGDRERYPRKMGRRGPYKANEETELDESGAIGKSQMHRVDPMISRPKFDEKGNVVLTKHAKSNITYGKKPRSRKLTGRVYDPKKKAFGEEKELDEGRDGHTPGKYAKAGRKNWFHNVGASTPKDEKTVLVSPRGYKSGGKVKRIPKSQYDPKKYSLAEEKKETKMRPGVPTDKGPNDPAFRELVKNAVARRDALMKKILKGDKTVKEETQLDELTNKKLGQYLGHAIPDKKNAEEGLRVRTRNKMGPGALKRIAKNRGEGIDRAAQRLRGVYDVGKPVSVMIPGKYDEPASGPYKIKRKKLYHGEETQLDETKKKPEWVKRTLKIKTPLTKDPKTGKLKPLKEEQIDEVITKKTPVGDVIHDFVHSDNKKFSGDSKKQRIKRALGAYYGKQRGE